MYSVWHLHAALSRGPLLHFSPSGREQGNLGSELACALVTLLSTKAASTAEEMGKYLEKAVSYAGGDIIADDEGVQCDVCGAKNTLLWIQV